MQPSRQGSGSAKSTVPIPDAPLLARLDFGPPLNLAASQLHSSPEDLLLVQPPAQAPATSSPTQTVIGDSEPPLSRVLLNAESVCNLQFHRTESEQNKQSGSGSPSPKSIDDRPATQRAGSRSRLYFRQAGRWLAIPFVVAWNMLDTLGGWFACECWDAEPEYGWRPPPERERQR